MDSSKLIAFIQSNWSLSNINLFLLQSKGGRFVYRLDSAQGIFVIKISDSAKDYDEMIRDLYILDNSPKQGFTNVPKLLKAKNANFIIPYEDRFSFIMEYIEGVGPEILQLFRKD